MKTIIVLAMHGMPPNDFPREEKMELFRLHPQIANLPADDPNRIRHDQLDLKMRKWTRTSENDPFWDFTNEIKSNLQKRTGNEVIVGYNEFCWPDMPEALNQAAQSGVEKVVVITPMVTRGGNHSEEEIPEAVDDARKRYPGIEFEYAWPYSADEVAEFLSEKISQKVS